MVVFFQGCPMRCKYCHNPDTWAYGTAKEMTADELLEQYDNNKAFYSNGGITATGGEPLVQLDFLTELYEKAKQRGIHTCIDTSGITYNPDNVHEMDKLEKLMEYTDLVMLDIKHIDSNQHKNLTGHDNKNILNFALFLEKIRKPVWIRHVVVPGVTDNALHLEGLGSFIGGLSNLRALDVLGYHTLGVNKYKELGISYPFEGIPQASDREVAESKKIIYDSLMKVRKQKFGK